MRSGSERSGGISSRVSVGSSRWLYPSTIQFTRFTPALQPPFGRLQDGILSLFKDSIRLCCLKAEITEREL
jgi:hypothetical protein